VSKPSLPMVMGIKNHMSKKMNCGGPVKMAEGGEVAEKSSPVFDHKDLAHAVMQKLAGGGMVDDGDDFLTAEGDDEAPDLGMPDDTDERMDAMSNGAEDDSHKGILHGIMNKIHRKHKG
jgi:hypothetical protein